MDHFYDIRPKNQVCNWWKDNNKLSKAINLQKTIHLDKRKLMGYLVRWREADINNATKISHQEPAFILKPTQIIICTGAPITTFLLIKNHSAGIDPHHGKFHQELGFHIKSNTSQHWARTKRKTFTTNNPILYTSPIHLYHARSQKWQATSPQVYRDIYSYMQNMLLLLLLSLSLSLLKPKSLLCSLLHLQPQHTPQQIPLPSSNCSEYGSICWTLLKFIVQ
jgi:hypothetical protein